MHALNSEVRLITRVYGMMPTCIVVDYVFQVLCAVRFIASD